MPRAIQAYDKQGRKYAYERPEQLVGLHLTKVEIDKNDWSQDQIRDYIRPCLAKYGGELIEW